MIIASQRWLSADWLLQSKYHFSSCRLKQLNIHNMKHYWHTYGIKFIFKPILSRFIGQAQMTRQGQLFSKILYQKVNHLSLSCSNTELTGNLLISLMKGAVYEWLRPLSKKWFFPSLNFRATRFLKFVYCCPQTGWFRGWRHLDGVFAPNPRWPHPDAAPAVLRPPPAGGPSHSACFRAGHAQRLEAHGWSQWECTSDL